MSDPQGMDTGPNLNQVGFSEMNTQDAIRSLHETVGQGNNAGAPLGAPPGTGGEPNAVGAESQVRDPEHVHSGRNTLLYLLQTYKKSFKDPSELIDKLSVLRNWDLKYVLDTRKKLVADVHDHLGPDLAMHPKVHANVSSQRRSVRNAVKDIVVLENTANALSDGKLWYDHEKKDCSFIINSTPLNMDINSLRDQIQQMMSSVKNFTAQSKLSQVEKDMDIVEQSSIMSNRPSRRVQWDITEPLSESGFGNNPRSKQSTSKASGPPTKRQLTMAQILKRQAGKRIRSPNGSETREEISERPSTARRRRQDRNAFKPGQIKTKAKESGAPTADIREGDGEEPMKVVMPTKRVPAAVRLTLREGFEVSRIREIISECCYTIAQYEYEITQMETLQNRERCRLVIKKWPDSENTRLWDGKFWCDMIQAEQWHFNRPEDLDKPIKPSSCIVKFITGCSPQQTEAGIEKHVRQQYAHDVENKGAEISVYKLGVSALVRERCRANNREPHTSFVVRITYT